MKSPRPDRQGMTEGFNPFTGIDFTTDELDAIEAADVRAQRRKALRGSMRYWKAIATLVAIGVAGWVVWRFAQ